MSENEASTTRWMTTGSSTNLDAETAAREAVEQALGDHTDTKLLIVLASVAYDIPAVAAAVKAAAPNVPMVGATSAGELSSAGPADMSVLITAIGGSGIKAAVRANETETPDRFVKAAEAAGAVNDIELFEHSALLMFQEGSGFGQSEAIRGAYSVTGAGIPLAGANSASLSFTGPEGNFQIFEGKALAGAVVCAAITSTGPIGIGVNSGYVAMGEPKMITKSDETFIYELDGRPAIEVYLEQLDAPLEAYSDPVAFTMLGLSHPLSFRRRSGDEAHGLMAGDFAIGSIFCPSMPEGSLVHVMQGDQNTILGANEKACGDAISGLVGMNPMGALVFNCAARKVILGARVEEEVSDISARIGAPIAGLYSFGELARVTGTTGLHNQTLVVMALA